MYDDDPDAPIPFDTEIEDDDHRVTCDQCGAAIYDDGDYCHECGTWITESNTSPKLDLRKPYRNTRLIAAGLLLLIAIAFIYQIILFLMN